MKILIVNTIKYNINGIANVIASFISGAKDKSIKIDITSNGFIDNKYKEIFNNNNVKIFQLPARKNIFKYAKALKKVVKNGDYDIVHIHGNSATMLLETLALKKCKAKIVVHCHNTKCKHNTIHRLLKNKFNKSFDYALACSKEAGEYAYNKHFTVIENGLDVKKFVFSQKDRDVLRKQYNLNNNIVCLHVGLFNNQKNQELLISASKDLPDEYKIVFAGDGETLQACQNLAKDLGVQNKLLFLGMQSDVSKFYSMADCFVFPSNYESFGLSLVEAQINGLPCLVSEQVSKFSKVNDKLVSYLPLVSNDWVAAISKVKTRKLIQQDKEMYSKFDIQNSTDKLIGFYKEIINNNIK